MERNRFGQEMEFPTLLIPLLHHGRFQLPLDDSQTPARPSEVMPWPQIYPRNLVGAESPPPGGPSKLAIRANALVARGGRFEEKYNDLDV